MFLGNSIEEKHESFDLLHKGAKKLGILFAILGCVASFLIILGAFGLEIEALGARVWLVLMAIIYPFCNYWMGYFWYYGFVTVKSWMVKFGITGRDVGTVAGGSIAVSYLIDGRRGAKLTGITFLAVMLIVLAIGFYVGMFNYFKVRKEIRKIYKLT